MNLKNNLKIILELIKQNFQIDFAYPLNAVGNLLSTIMYTIVALIFINVIFSNTKSFAGYSKNELIIFQLIGQINFYISWYLSFLSNLELIEDVKKGNFDLLLIKPVNLMLYLAFKRFSLFSVLRDGIPPICILIFAVSWKNLTIEPVNLLVSIIVMILGFFCVHFIMIFSAVPVFYYGESSSILGSVSSTMGFLSNFLPYEGFSKKMQFFFTFVVPLIVSTGLSVSVLLGKTKIFTALFLSCLSCLLFVTITLFLWKKAIKNYSSASS